MPLPSVRQLELCKPMQALVLQFLLQRLHALPGFQRGGAGHGTAQGLQAGGEGLGGRRVGLLHKAVSQQAGTPAPELSLDHGGLWVTFHFPPAVAGAPEEMSAETTQNTTQNTTQKILAILRAQPQASRKDIAAQIGDLTADGVKYQLAKLKAKGWIRRVGPDRGGRWEVLV